jgi:glycosyltransferase involved in cell wall biosynthesis
MDDFRKISIVIPIFNEKKTLEKIIEAVENASVFGMEKEIVLVDDGSTDGTLEILKNYEAKYKVIYHKKNRGKGSSLKTGFKNSTGGIIIVQDADLEYDPNEYEQLLEPIIAGRADAVFSSRFLSSKPHRVLYFWHYAGNKIITAFSNMFTNLNLTDIESGYKVFSRETLDQIYPELKSKRFGFEPEAVARCANLSKKGKCRIYEVGISYAGRTYEEGKKIGWIDGIEAIWCIIRYNLFD